jgi:hypothetical protein
MSSSATSPSSDPIPIINKRLSPPGLHSFDYSPGNTSHILDSERVSVGNYNDDIGVTCPPAFLPRERQNSQIQFDVFHHPAELHTPPESSKIDLKDPFTSAQLHEEMTTRINIDLTSSPPQQFASISFENSRSPVIAIHHSRIGPIPPEDEDGEAELVSRTISGLSLSGSNNEPGSRRMSSIASSETTYVPMTPLPMNCSLALFDRPREMATLIQKNADLFTLIEHTVSSEKYEELQSLWKTPRELVSDEDWVERTRNVISIGADHAEGGALWVRWKELVGWDSDDEEEEEDDDDDYWSYQPQDTRLHQRWNELDKARASISSGEEGSGVMEGRPFGSGIGLSGMGTSLCEIKENEEEEELDDGERPVTMKNSRKS